MARAKSIKKNSPLLGTWEYEFLVNSSVGQPYNIKIRKTNFSNFLFITDGMPYTDWPDEYLIYAVNLLKKRPNEMIGQRDEALIADFYSIKKYIIENFDGINQRLQLSKLRK